MAETTYLLFEIGLPLRVRTLRLRFIFRRDTSVTLAIKLLLMSSIYSFARPYSPSKESNWLFDKFNSRRLTRHEMPSDAPPNCCDCESVRWAPDSDLIWLLAKFSFIMDLLKKSKFCTIEISKDKRIRIIL